MNSSAKAVLLPAVIVALLSGASMFAPWHGAENIPDAIPYSDPHSEFIDKIEKDGVRNVVINEHEVRGDFVNGDRFRVNIPHTSVIDTLLAHRVRVEVANETDFSLLTTILTLPPPPLLVGACRSNMCL